MKTSFTDELSTNKRFWFAHLDDLSIPRPLLARPSRRGGTATRVFSRAFSAWIDILHAFTTLVLKNTSDYYKEDVSFYICVPGGIGINYKR